MIFHDLKRKLELMLVTLFFRITPLHIFLILFNVRMMFLISMFGMMVIQGSTGVMFSDVAGIDEAVEELQEVLYLCIS